MKHSLDPARIAEEIRSEIWGDGFPVDPVKIAKELDIRVVGAELPENVSGAIIKKKNKDTVIILHSDDSVSRRRFSCAHELGHFLCRLEENRDLIEYEYMDLRGDAASLGTEPDEIFANSFAANLLMPEKEVRKRYSDVKNLSLLAVRFGVSPQALRFRLNNLGLIDIE